MPAGRCRAFFPGVRCQEEVFERLPLLHQVPQVELAIAQKIDDRIDALPFQKQHFPAVAKGGNVVAEIADLGDGQRLAGRRGR